MLAAVSAEAPAKRLWRTNVDESAPTGELDVTRKGEAVVVGGSHVASYDASTGRRVWRADVESSVTDLDPPTTVIDGTPLVVRGEDGEPTVLDPATGRVRTAFDVKGDLVAPVATGSARSGTTGSIRVPAGSPRSRRRAATADWSTPRVRWCGHAAAPVVAGPVVYG